MRPYCQQLPHFLLWLLFAGGIIRCSAPTTGPLIFERLSYYQPPDFRDSILAGTYSVFADQRAKKGPMIDLHVEVVPAIDRTNLKEPIFFLDGGPGVGVSHWTYFFSQEDSLYRQNRDLVFLDVRGTGNSGALNCLAMQTINALEEFFSSPYSPENITACLQAWQDSINLQDYNTDNIIQDFEEVRQWLGYEKINLYGMSYGGKVALRYMSQYPTSIHRAVLHSPSDPRLNNHYLRAIWSQNALDYVFLLCQNDSLCQNAFPDLKKEFQELQSRLRTKAPLVRYDRGPEDTISLSWEAVATRIYSNLYADYDYVRLPYLIHEAYLGNYLPFIQEFHFERGVPNLFFAEGQFLSIICAEEIGLPFTEVDLEQTFLGDIYYQRRKKACQRWPVEDLSVQYESGVQSEVPTLIISGQADPVTPPETGRLLCEALTNCQQIVIPYMGHELGDLSNLACYDEYVMAFFAEEEQTVEVDCFEQMRPLPFRISETK